MRRRQFITLLGGAAVGWPLAARAQTAPKIARVGWIWGGRAGKSDEVDGFRQGLRELGYTEGQNITVEYRFGEGSASRFSEFVDEMVRLRADVILTIGTGPSRVAQKATGSIPIIAMAGDAVASGLVASLARPGGNITGLSLLNREGLSGKWMEFLKEMVPGLSRVGVFFSPDSPLSALIREQAETAARTLGLTLRPLPIRNNEDFAAHVAALAREPVDGLILDPSDTVVAYYRQVADIALKHRIATVSEQREFATLGGLLTYGPSVFDVTRRMAHYMDKILKGTKPADIPVEQPTKFVLTVNLKTGKALGLRVPESLLLRADEVIE